MIAFVQEVPISKQAYERIRDLLGPVPPEGLITHVAQMIPGGIRYTDVWESQEALDRFTDERLHPVIGQILREFQIEITEEPPRVPVEVIHAWNGTGRQ
jgi:hypothetical protein